MKVTSAAFHKKTHVMITGFDDGVFYLHEMPNLNLIHSLRSAVGGTGLEKFSLIPSAGYRLQNSEGVALCRKLLYYSSIVTILV